MAPRIFVAAVLSMLAGLAALQLASLWPLINASHEAYELEALGAVNLGVEGKAVRLHGLAIDREGSVWVAEVQPPDPHIVIVDRDGVRQRSFPAAAAAGIAIDGDTLLTVRADAPIMRRFSANGDVIEELQINAPGIYVPSGVARTVTGYAVTGAGSGRMYLLDGTGNQTAVLGVDAQGMPQLVDPSYPMLDAKGRIYASDRSGRVLRWDGAEADATFRTRGRVAAVLSGPRGAAVDGRGRLWVADPDARRIWVFSEDGDLLGSWMPPGVPRPMALAISDRRIYVADAESPILQWFALPD